MEEELNDMHKIDSDEFIKGANDLNDDNKLGLKLAAEFMRSNGLDEAAHDLLNQYEMKVLPTFNMDDSEFVQRMKAENIPVNLQGYMKVGHGDEAIRYPMLF